MAPAAIFYEGGLQAGLHPDDLGQVDIALELLFGSGLDVEVFEAVTVQHHTRVSSAWVASMSMRFVMSAVSPVRLTARREWRGAAAAE